MGRFYGGTRHLGVESKATFEVQSAARAVSNALITLGFLAPGSMLTDAIVTAALKRYAASRGISMDVAGAAAQKEAAAPAPTPQKAASQSIVNAATPQAVAAAVAETKATVPIVRNQALVPPESIPPENMSERANAAGFAPYMNRPEVIGAPVTKGTIPAMYDEKSLVSLFPNITMAKQPVPSATEAQGSYATSALGGDVALANALIYLGFLKGQMGSITDAMLMSALARYAKAHGLSTTSGNWANIADEWAQREAAGLNPNPLAIGPAGEEPVKPILNTQAEQKVQQAVESDKRAGVHDAVADDKQRKADQAVHTANTAATKATMMPTFDNQQAADAAAQRAANAQADADLAAQKAAEANKLADQHAAEAKAAADQAAAIAAAHQQGYDESVADADAKSIQQVLDTPGETPPPYYDGGMPPYDNMVPYGAQATASSGFSLMPVLAAGVVGAIGYFIGGVKGAAAGAIVGGGGAYFLTRNSAPSAPPLIYLDNTPGTTPEEAAAWMQQHYPMA